MRRRTLLRKLLKQKYRVIFVSISAIIVSVGKSINLPATQTKDLQLDADRSTNHVSYMALYWCTS